MQFMESTSFLHRRRRRRLRVYFYKALRPHIFRPRLLVAAVAGFGLHVLATHVFGPLRAALVAFDVTSLLVIAACLTIAARTGPRLMPRRAGEENEQKFTVLITGVTVSAVILAGLALELIAVKQREVDEIALASATIVLAWGFLNMLFAFHYAHEFYRRRRRNLQPLSFPGTHSPDYFDFIYFAFTIGMTFQVSDVSIRSSPIRHIAFLHALVAFFFNVIVLALIVNVLVGVFYFG
jgi:uncharacterized membrane protein